MYEPWVMLNVLMSLDTVFKIPLGEKTWIIKEFLFPIYEHLL
jgi:hypothetical protein